MITIILMILIKKMIAPALRLMSAMGPCATKNSTIVIASTLRAVMGSTWLSRRRASRHHFSVAGTDPHGTHGDPLVSVRNSGRFKTTAIMRMTAGIRETFVTLKRKFPNKFASVRPIGGPCVQERGIQVFWRYHEVIASHLASMLSDKQACNQPLKLQEARTPDGVKCLLCVTPDEYAV